MLEGLLMEPLIGSVENQRSDVNNQRNKIRAFSILLIKCTYSTAYLLHDGQQGNVNKVWS